jgi:hypothetical protein
MVQGVAQGDEMFGYYETIAGGAGGEHSLNTLCLLTFVEIHMEH